MKTVDGRRGSLWTVDCVDCVDEDFVIFAIVAVTFASLLTVANRNKSKQAEDWQQRDRGKEIADWHEPRYANLYRESEREGKL